MAAFTLQRTGPQGTHNVPGNNGPGGGGVARAQGGGRGSDKNASNFPQATLDWPWTITVEYSRVGATGSEEFSMRCSLDLGTLMIGMRRSAAEPPVASSGPPRRA